jgi:cytochrome P450
MINTDAPRHTRLRLLVNKAFTPGTVEELTPFIQSFVDNVLAAAQARGRMDVMAELAFPLPATVIAEMLGVPPEDRDRFKHWSDDTTAAAANLPSNLPPDVLRKSIAAMEELQTYFRGIIAERRTEPVLRAGQKVLLLGAANRDPQQFPDPDRLEVSRPDNKQIAFGLGSHFCLGAPLAQLEGRIVFEALLGRAPGMRLDGPPPLYRQNFNLRGFESLQVTL